MVNFNKSTQGFGHDECYISENDGSILVYPKLYTTYTKKAKEPKNEIAIEFDNQSKNHTTCLIL